MSKTPRTQQEILDRIKAVKNDDIFGHQRGDLVDYLECDNAMPFISVDKVSKEQWRTVVVDNLKTPKEQMIAYMPFAFEKANGKRGLSASRSLEHYTAWLWLDGDEEIWPTLEDYENYGKDHLVTICKYLGIDPNQWDDGVRENS